MYHSRSRIYYLAASTTPSQKRLHHEASQAPEPETEPYFRTTALRFFFFLRSSFVLYWRVSVQLNGCYARLTDARNLQKIWKTTVRKANVTDPT